MSERPPLDDELQGLFERPSDAAFAQRLHAVKGRSVEADPAFKEALRRRLMQEAWRQKEPRRPWYRRLLGPPGLAWAGAVVGVLLIVFATVTLSQNTGGSTSPTFTSPINGRTQVATTAAIVVDFPQPMDTAATQAAAKITPATEASYHWSNDDQTLTITPKNDGLAPGVQYQVTFTAAAKTESDQPLTTPSASPSPITFVTQQPAPTPAPTPATGPTSPIPTPTPSPLSGTRQLGPSGGAQAVWSLDGSTIYVIGPGGALTSYPAAGGAATTVAPSSVSQVVAGPEGPASLAGNTVAYDGQSWTVSGASSIGFESTTAGMQLAAVSGTTVSAVGGTGGVTLNTAPTAPAAFSPTGAELVYLGSDGLHLVDLASGVDQTIGAASGLGSWSPDGSQFAYVDQGSLSILDVASQATTSVSGLTGVSAVSWTDNGLLVSTGAGLEDLSSPTAAPVQLAGAAAKAGSWSPASALIAYVQAGDAYVATSADTSSALIAASNLVTQFMAARESGNANEADSLLTTSGRAAFTPANGLYLTSDDSQTLNRWSMILAEPSGVVAVRTVFSQGTQESVFDEQFQVAASGSGQYQITQASGTPISTGPSGGPAIQSMSVSANSVSVRFDSDVNPATVAGGVTVDGASGALVAPQSTSYDAVTRTVTVSLPTLSAAQRYGLTVSSGLKDVDGNSATHVQIAFTSPSAPAPSAGPSPSPTPSS